MYARFFGLAQQPFSIAPDPRLLFMSERHREALAHLLYGLGGPGGGSGGGFVLLTGEIGTGKTIICRCFLEQIPAHCNVAYIFNPKLTVIELLQSICDEFHVAVRCAEPATVGDYLGPLNRFLLDAHAAGRNNLLIIDEAQNLAPEVLEQLRLLTNLETSERKLLQIVLIGQPELRDMLAKPELEQLAQRVIARFHLDALSETETAHYVHHRLEAAGLAGPIPFDRPALRRVHSLTRGVPRRINLLCDRALLGAFATGQARVGRRIVERAASEVFGQARRGRAAWRRGGAPLAMGLLAGAGLVAGVSYMQPQVWTAQSPGQPGADGEIAVAPVSPAPRVKADVAALPEMVRGAVPPPVLLGRQDQAWRELGQAWGVTLLEDEGEPCRELARQQAQCFSRDIPLSLIRQLGRPGIVTLDARTGKPSYALLTGLTADSATLRAAGSEQTVTLMALAERWQGEFATLWRPPPGYGGPLREGQGGPAVEWIAARLPVAAGPAAPGRHTVLGVELRERVRAFQLAQGLPVDGDPGPMTLMQLNRVAGVEEPRLHTGP